LQLAFVQTVLERAQLEFAAEGVPYTHASISNNSLCVSLLDGPGGIFSLLDEACQLNRSQTASSDGIETAKGLVTYLNQRLQQHGKQQKTKCFRPS
jgi:myosin heavy subunit